MVAIPPTIGEYDKSSHFWGYTMVPTKNLYWGWSTAGFATLPRWHVREWGCLRITVGLLLELRAAGCQVRAYRCKNLGTWNMLLPFALVWPQNQRDFHHWCLGYAEEKYYHLVVVKLYMSIFQLGKVLGGKTLAPSWHFSTQRQKKKMCVTGVNWSISSI